MMHFFWSYAYHARAGLNNTLCQLLLVVVVTETVIWDGTVEIIPDSVHMYARIVGIP